MSTGRLLTGLLLFGIITRMIPNQHICKSCRHCVQQNVPLILPSRKEVETSILYWCIRAKNIAMFSRAKVRLNSRWMPVIYRFGCRFWVERRKGKGEMQRIVDEDYKTIRPATGHKIKVKTPPANSN
jgi:hypothetical protein